MTRSTCLISGCTTHVHAEGLCAKHSYRKRKYGNALVSRSIHTSAAKPAESGSNSIACPMCDNTKSATKDSREGKDGLWKRRRECLSCHARFTTYEVSEDYLTKVTTRNHAVEQATKALTLLMSTANAS